VWNSCGYRRYVFDQASQGEATQTAVPDDRILLLALINRFSTSLCTATPRTPQVREKEGDSEDPLLSPEHRVAASMSYHKKQ